MIRKNSKRIYIGVIAAILIIGAYSFYRFKKQAFLDHGLKDLVANKTDQLYKVSYDSIHLNEATGDLYIKNLHITGDTSRQDELIKTGDTNVVKLLLDVFVPSLEVKGFKTDNALLSKHLDCKYIIINNPKVVLNFYPGVGKQEEEKQKQQLYKQLLGDMKLIKADSISIINGQATAIDFFTKETKFKTAGTNVNLYQVAIDSTYNQDTTRVFFCKEISINIGSLSIGQKESQVSAENILFNTRNDLISIKTVAHTSLHNGNSFKGIMTGVTLKGFTATGPVEETEVKIGEAVFNKTFIETVSSGKKTKEEPSNPHQKILTGWIKHFALGKLDLKTIDYHNKQTDEPQNSFNIVNSSILASNVRIDTTSAFNETLVNNARDFEFTNDQVVLNSGDGNYQYRVTGLHLSSAAKKITVKEIRVIPQLGEEAFAKKAKYQGDRYDITIRNLAGSNVSIEKFIKGEVYIDHVSTNGNSIKVYRDLAYPIDSGARERPPINFFPQQELYKLKPAVAIKKFSALNTSIQYKERNDISRQSGNLRFSHSNIVISNLSNLPPKPGEKMIARFTTTIVDSIPMSGSFTFYSDQYKKGNFEVEATSIKAIDAGIFNQLMIPMGLTRVDKGKLYSAKIHITGDTLVANATIALAYEDFKLSLLNRKADKYHKKNVFSFVANALIRDKSNKDHQPRSADVKFSYDRYKSFFNYIWKTIFSGIRSILLKV